MRHREEVQEEGITFAKRVRERRRLRKEAMIALVNGTHRSTESWGDFSFVGVE